MFFTTFSSVVIGVRTQSSHLHTESIKMPEFQGLLLGGNTLFAVFVILGTEIEGLFSVKYK